jgi:hypothetical protein
MTGTAAPNVAGKVGEEAGAMGNAGHLLGSSLMGALEAEVRARVPQIVAQIQRDLSAMTVSPSITVNPRVNMGTLQGIHSDVGVDVAR